MITVAIFLFFFDTVLSQSSSGFEKMVPLLLECVK
jgi:hypothetical protein